MEKATSDVEMQLYILQDFPTDLNIKTDLNPSIIGTQY
jgi:hypothetical protein